MSSGRRFFRLLFVIQFSSCSLFACRLFLSFIFLFLLWNNYLSLLNFLRFCSFFNFLRLWSFLYFLRLCSFFNLLLLFFYWLSLLQFLLLFLLLLFLLNLLIYFWFLGNISRINLMGLCLVFSFLFIRQLLPHLRNLFTT